MEIWTTIILPILSGLITAIPLLITLVKYIQKVIKEKNWGAVVQLVLKLMAEAEQLYSDGAEKKQYVMSAIKEMESTLQYDVDEKAIGDLIDSVVTATKKINIK